MKIRQVNSFFRTIRLNEPYAVAYDSFDKCESVFINVLTGNGISGWGCAAPDPGVTAETATEVLRCASKVIEPYLKGSDVFRYGLIMDELGKLIPDKPGALAMVDMALHDIIAQKAGVPLYQLLGGYRDSIPTSVTIGIMPVKQSLSYARLYVSRGFGILKVKGGCDVLEDIDKMIRIRELVGKHIVLRFDANQGYSLQDALDFLKGVRNADIELLEQPTQKRDFDTLKMITQKSDLPVMADESLITLRDAFLLSRDQCIDLINIKLMKTGGILEAMHVNSVARAAGINVMVGCMDESALGISAGLHFTLSRPNITLADLDGHLDLVDDPFAGLVKISDGRLIPSDSPGLGVSSLKRISI